MTVGPPCPAPVFLLLQSFQLTLIPERGTPNLTFPFPFFPDQEDTLVVHGGTPYLLPSNSCPLYLAVLTFGINWLVGLRPSLPSGSLRIPAAARLMSAGILLEDPLHPPPQLQGLNRVAPFDFPPSGSFLFQAQVTKDLAYTSDSLRP